MPLQLDALRDASLSAGADPAKAEMAAEELAGYEKLENRLVAFEGCVDARFSAFEGRVDARFSTLQGEVNLLKWMVGFVIAVELILLGLVLRLAVH